MKKHEAADPCPDPACDGYLEAIHDEGEECTCFLSSPCSYCTDFEWECSECGEHPDDYTPPEPDPAPPITP